MNQSEHKANIVQQVASMRKLGNESEVTLMTAGSSNHTISILTYSIITLPVSTKLQDENKNNQTKKIVLIKTIPFPPPPSARGSPRIIRRHI